MASLKENIQIGCVSQDNPQKKSILQKDGKLGSNYTVKFSKTAMRTQKFWKERVSQKCEPQERVPWAPKDEERTQNETLRQERCAREAAWNLARDVFKVKKKSHKIRFTLLPQLG